MTLDSPAYFFNSSAIVKRYHREPGTVWIQSISEPRSHPPLYLSDLARVEVIAALRRLGRTHKYHPSFVDTMTRSFERHISLSDIARPAPLYHLVPLTRSVLALASALCNQYWQAQPHPLRSLDAIQLACARAIALNIDTELVFVTADVRLAAIAPLEGLSVVNPGLVSQG
jgi:predicted nucleic acid-binding protein